MHKYHKNGITLQQDTIAPIPIPVFVKNARTWGRTLVGNNFSALPHTHTNYPHFNYEKTIKKTSQLK